MTIELFWTAKKQRRQWRRRQRQWKQKQWKQKQWRQKHWSNELRTKEQKENDNSNAFWILDCFLLFFEGGNFFGCGRRWAWNWRWHFAAVSLSNFSDTLAVQIIPETWARGSGQNPGCLRSPSGIQQLYASSVFQRSRLSPNYARRGRALGRGRFLAAAHDALQVLDSQSVCHGEESFSKNLFVN